MHRYPATPGGDKRGWKEAKSETSCLQIWRYVVCFVRVYVLCAGWVESVRMLSLGISNVDIGAI